MSPFEDLIHNLGNSLETSLKAEGERFCRLKMKSGLSIQIEFLSSKDSLLLSSYLCEIPPGKFRIDIITKALKANHTSESLGSLAYLDKNNNLVLELYLPTSTAPELLAERLKQFEEKGLLWKEAIEQGHISLIDRGPCYSLPSSVTK